MTEEWRPVLGYEGLYEVSDQGNLRRRSRGKRLKAEQVIEMRAMLADGATLKKTAMKFGVSIVTAMRIKHGVGWKGDPDQRPVKPSRHKFDYLIFRPCRNGKYGQYLVHRAVWEAFNGPIPGRLEVNHKNLIRTDNRLENLELLTHQQNTQHAQDIYNVGMAYIEPGKRGGPKSMYARRRAAQKFEE